MGLNSRIWTQSTQCKVNCANPACHETTNNIAALPPTIVPEAMAVMQQQPTQIHYLN
jgi:hypothetical protein